MKGNDDILENVVKYLVEKLDIKAIILFGSRARGDYTPWSDYDLLIIGDFKENYLDRIKVLLEMIGNVPMDIEPHPYTLKEALEMLRKGNPMIVDALEDGRPLYSTMDIDILMKLYRELKRKGLRRTNTSIKLP